MRILVCASHHLVAYPIVRDLRQHATFILGVHSGPGTSAIGKSKLLDSVLDVPLAQSISPHASFEEGRNTSREYEWITRIAQVCTQHGLDTVFPTSDNEILVIARNENLLRAHGITAIAPPLHALRTLIDKAEATRLAQRAGVPTPRTRFPTSPEELTDACEQIRYPVVLKARFAFGGMGVQYVAAPTELPAALAKIRRWDRIPFVQEYVPGGTEPSINVLTTRESHTLGTFTVNKTRYVHTSLSTAVEIAPALPETDAVARMLEASGTIGFSAVQMKRDSRDGVHRFIEVNPRFGANFRILSRIGRKAGTNLSHAVIDTHRNPTPTPVRLPIGARGTSPVEDVVAVAKYLHARRSPTLTSDNPPPPPTRYLAGLGRSYLRPGRASDTFFASTLNDFAFVRAAYTRTLHELRGRERTFVPFGQS